MTLDAPAQSFIYQVSDLLTTDLHIGEPLTCQQQLGGQGICLWNWARNASAFSP